MTCLQMMETLVHAGNVSRMMILGTRQFAKIHMFSSNADNVSQWPME